MLRGKTALIIAAATVRRLKEDTTAFSQSGRTEAARNALEALANQESKAKAINLFLTL